jgi:hypothetical protein
MKVFITPEENIELQIHLSAFLLFNLCHKHTPICSHSDPHQSLMEFDNKLFPACEDSSNYDYSYQSAIEIMKQEIFLRRPQLGQDLKLQKLNDELFQLDELTDKFARNFQKALLSNMTRKNSSDGLRSSNNLNNSIQTILSNLSSLGDPPRSFCYGDPSPLFPTSILEEYKQTLSLRNYSNSNTHHHHNLSNSNPPTTTLPDLITYPDMQCISWARWKIPIILEQAIISFLSSSCDYICSTKSKIPSHLFQPFEEFVFYVLYSFAYVYYYYE